MKCSAVITIPARLASQRLPNKMLLDETGFTLIEHTWRNASKVSKAIDVFVVTDSDTIREEVQGFGGKAIMTSPDATSGTARIVEALPSLPDADIVVNLQGDEPELVPSAVDAAITCLEEYPKAHVATLVTPLREKGALHDPSVVKAELTPWAKESLQQDLESYPQVWRAITFSRAAVPAAREWHDDLLKKNPPVFWQHVGVYAYRRTVLNKWTCLPESALAELESLEQLRLIEAGMSMIAVAIEQAANGIDTAADYSAFVNRFRNQ